MLFYCKIVKHTISFAIGNSDIRNRTLKNNWEKIERMKSPKWWAQNDEKNFFPESFGIWLIDPRPTPQIKFSPGVSTQIESSDVTQ